MLFAKPCITTLLFQKYRSDSRVQQKTAKASVSTASDSLAPPEPFGGEQAQLRPGNIHHVGGNGNVQPVSIIADPESLCFLLSSCAD
jgi:hypothetical protein